jgi:hypothetical protein
MSGSRLVRDSRDLSALVADGYAVRIVSGYLVVDDIPFVNDAGQVQWGAFLCPLDNNGLNTITPATHVMCIVGGVPRDKTGAPIDGLVNDGVDKWSAGPDLTAACGFSQKPAGGYQDFYEKVTYYTQIVIGPAQAVDPSVTPYTFKPVETDEGDGVFRYMDTFSPRYGITELNNRLVLNKVAIVGLGGTGAHILDALVKTPVQNLHLYDGDVFLSHNAFRAPGAASIEDLRAGLTKVAYYERVYSAMRRGIYAHPFNVTVENVDELLDADFVFLAMDAGPDKKVIIDALVVAGIPFVDTGIGLGKDSKGVNGTLRVTTFTPGHGEHIDKVVSYFVGEDAEYDTNLQVDELNALTANLAVLRYKKLLAFYADLESEHHTVFDIDSGNLSHRFGNRETEGAG